MSQDGMEPLVVSAEDGTDVDLTPLVQRFQDVKYSAMKDREHAPPNSVSLAVSVDTVRGVQMGMQLALDALFGSKAANAFARRVDPTAPDWMYKPDK